MKKWNCNIVANMYDRVIRRKFGLLCNDDTSNEDFINSYINRLDCTPINLQCVDSQPCDSITTITECNLILSVTLQLEPTNSIYTFVPDVLNAVGTPTYNWTYNPLHWTFVSLINGILKLEPTITNGSTITTTVSLVVEDERGCKANFTTGKFDYLGGCTDPDAINYNPDATFNNGSCYYTELSFSISYICQPDTSGTIVLNILGGVGPYTVVGTQNGTNLPNGSLYSAYVIDSVGNTTPIQSGTIVCPFDCETIEIVDNFDSVCLTDDFGNTGNAQIFCNPSGGTAPYTTTISINGNPPITFTNGSIVSNLDELIIYIVDANGCEYTSIPYTIDCPPFEPGGGGTCDELMSALEGAGTEFYLALRANNRIFTGGFGGGYRLYYQINYAVANLPLGYTLANISNIQTEVTNISPVGLIQQYNGANLPCSTCLYSQNFPQAINNYPLLPIWFNFLQFSATYNTNCIDEAQTEILRVNVKTTLTFTTEDATCYLCGENEIELEYSPCDRVFLEETTIQLHNLEICP